MASFQVVAEELGEEVSTIAPAVIGVSVFVLLLVLLFIVTRFNPDR